jgi:predicted DNA-binding transcriptional regulator
MQIPRISAPLSVDKDVDKKAIAESQLKGNTLRTYIYVVTHKKSGVREIQRELHFSSSSLAQYHLGKLVDLGLLNERGGEYYIADQVKVDVLKDFLKLGSIIVPRFIFYAVFFTIVTAFFGFIAIESSVSDLVLILIGLLVASSALFWYEALRAWLRGPV